MQTVDPELAERVRTSAERLGYRANRVARALRRQSTQTIGLIIPDITKPFFPPVVQAIERELRDGGFSLLLGDAGHDVAAEAELVHTMFDHQIDGLLISACDRRASRAAIELAASRVPLLQIDLRAMAELPYAGIDQDDAMRQVVEHLREQGCRTFGYISPAPDISSADERLSAYRSRAGALDPGAAERVLLGDFSVSWGHEAATRLLKARNLPDALICASDQTAAGALQALRENGVKVPDDVAVTGFDDSVLAVTCQPQLTTVRQPLAELGRLAVTMLNAAIASPSSRPDPAVLKAELVVRASSQR